MFTGIIEGVGALAGADFFEQFGDGGEGHGFSAWR